MRLRQAKQTLRGLTLRQLLEIEPWLRELIEESKSSISTTTTGVAKVDKGARVGSKTYQLEHVRCGKENCKCAEGYLHGPYWYAYWSEGGKVRSQYIGKRLPRGVKPQRIAKSRGVR